MDPYQRGRSPSAGPAAAGASDIRRSPSPSPNPAFNSQANAFGYDPSLLGPANSSLADPLNPQSQFQQQSSFAQQQYQQSNNNPSAASFAYAAAAAAPNAPSQQQAAYRSGQFMSQQAQLSQSAAAAAFVSFDDPSSQFGESPNDDLSNQEFDSSLFLDFDPSLADPQAAAPSDDSTNLFENMSTTHQRSPDAPHLLRPGMQQSLDSSGQSSPSFYQDQYNQASLSRHTSLSPSSANYMQNNGGDYVGLAFQTHRRAPSDQHSDVSSSHASPYLQNHESFESQTSPLINGGQDAAAAGPNHLDMSQFSLSDPHHISPGQSSHASPNLDPSQAMPMYSSTADGLGMSGMDDQFIGLQASDAFGGQEAFPPLQPHDSLHDIGQASQMSPPEITFDPAPPSKQPSFNEANPAERHGGALSLPGPSRNRQRARSDPYSSAASSRSTSPARPRSPSDGGGLRPNDSLATHSRSRSVSPSGPAGGVQKSYRRSSSPAVPMTDAERARMLGIAERAQSPQPPYAADRAPSPTPSTISNISDGAGGVSAPKRAQKHPATFQCHLCPKRFTRAYNLRSHLRTHTDERPFVCTVCGKAFARQHDRKRHEGLHSGEKKFVCRGTLAGSGGTWGCNRKFARADALGRHFRSEAGRSCIKPLLDEEAHERNLGMMSQGGHDMMHGAGVHPGSAQAHMMGPQQGPMGPMPFNGMALPAALLQQYPALAGISWDAPLNQPGADSSAGDYDGSDFGDASGGDFGEYSTRSSFEAAYEDEESGYKSDAGYGSTLDPSFVQAAGAWPMAAGGTVQNGYYSDRGGQ